jgi:hypothetical protein
MLQSGVLAQHTQVLGGHSSGFNFVVLGLVLNNSDNMNSTLMAGSAWYCCNSHSNVIGEWWGEVIGEWLSVF